MKPNPVVYRTLIVRNQIEYSAATQTVITRCVLETPSSGQRQGFTDIEALLAALRDEIRQIQSLIIPLEQKEGEIKENP